MIEFRNVSLSARKKEILKEVSFRCEKGRITSIIGRNGAGKTSALKCLIGEKRYTGEILLEKSDIQTYSIRQRARRISYLSQSLPDTPFTVYELAALGRKPYHHRMGKLSDIDHQIIQDALKRTDMFAFSKRRVDSLSGGEKQRAYLAMVLAQETDVIALDEPATYMDASVEKETFEILKMLSGEMGKTIIQVVHNLSRAVNDSDCIVMMDNGRVISEMEAEEMMKSRLIEEIFAVEKSMIAAPDGKIRAVYL